MTAVETEDPWNEDRWSDGLNMDVEAPHCRECDDYHWGPCPQPWPATPLERAFATPEQDIVDEAMKKIGSQDQPSSEQT